MWPTMAQVAGMWPTNLPRASKRRCCETTSRVLSSDTGSAQPQMAGLKGLEQSWAMIPTLAASSQTGPLHLHLFILCSGGCIMSRTAGVSIPRYRLHKPRGLAKVTICGKDHYLGAWGSKASRVEYERTIKQWEADGRPTAPRRPQWRQM